MPRLRGLVQLGKMNRLVVVKEVDFGFYLDGGEFGEILLPHGSTDELHVIDDIVDVFVSHVWNDRTSANDKNLTTPRDRTHRIVLESYDRNSPNTGFQTRRRH